MKTPELISASLRILIADADDTFRQTLRDLAEDAGFIVVGEERTAAAAHTAAKKLKPDAVLLASDLPGQVDLSLAEVIHSEKIAPVVLIASELNAATARKAASLGIYSFLIKPLQFANLYPTIEIAHSNWIVDRQIEQKLARLQTQDETRSAVEKAKQILMTAHGLTETKAYRVIQKRSMNTRSSMREVAQSVLDLYQKVPVEVSRRDETPALEVAA